jgi:hypothetical protein
MPDPKVRKPAVREYVVDEEFSAVTSYIVTARSKAEAIQIVHDDYKHEVCETLGSSDAFPTGRWWAQRMGRGVDVPVARK